MLAWLEMGYRAQSVRFTLAKDGFTERSWADFDAIASARGIARACKGTIAEQGSSDGTVRASQKEERIKAK